MINGEWVNPTEIYKSYTFKIKKILPISNHQIREIVTNGGVVFLLLLNGNLDAVNYFLDRHPLLNYALKKWVEWGETEALKYWKGYGFRIKEDLPFGAGEIKQLILRGRFALEYLVEEDFDNLLLFFKENPDLKKVFQDWQEYAEERFIKWLEYKNLLESDKKKKKED